MCSQCSSSFISPTYTHSENSVHWGTATHQLRQRNTTNDVTVVVNNLRDRLTEDFIALALTYLKCQPPCARPGDLCWHPPADWMWCFRIKYSLGERKRRKSGEARLTLHVYDTLIASMIIPPHYGFPAHIYSCVQFSLCSSLWSINNLRKCAGTPRHTP